MKKTYSKPEVLFEDFRLVDSISNICGAGLEYHPTSGDPENCSVNDPAIGVLFLNVEHCGSNPPVGMDYLGGIADAYFGS